MEEQHAVPFLRETLLFLALAGILIPLLQRLRINQVLGFLAAGALIGPFGLGLWIEQAAWLNYMTVLRPEGIAVLGNLGVLFLMFMIGLDLSAERLWALRHWVFGAGVAQVTSSAAIIGGIAWWWFDVPIEAATVLGLILALSSTAVVMQLLSERVATGSPMRQTAFSILMLQDLAVVPIFILVGVLAKGESDNLVPTIAMTLAKSIGAVLLIYLLGRRLIRPLFRSFAKQHQPDVFMALTLFCTLGISAATAASGLSMALGAFLAGLLLAETEFRHQVEVIIEPFKGLLMGLFFMSVGMQTDVRVVMQAPLTVPVLVIGLILVKAGILAIIFRIGGFNWGRAIEGGLLMGQGGEFAFVVVGYALTTQLMTPELGQLTMLVVALSLFATPLAARGGRLCAEWWERSHVNQASNLSTTALPPMAGQVIIVGFGRVGQLLAQVLRDQDIPYIAVESDARVAARLHSPGLPVYYGDASRAEFLRKLQANTAAAIVLTMDQPTSALQAVRAIRRECPHLPLFARSRDEKHAIALKQAGANVVIPETLEAGLQLSGIVLQTLGLSDSVATRVVQNERDRRIAIMQGETAKQ